MTESHVRRRMYGQVPNRDQIIEDMKKLLTEGMVVQDITRLVEDIFKYVKSDEAEFVQSMKKLIMDSTIKGYEVAMFMDQLVNNTGHRVDSQKWALLFSSEIVEISQKILLVDTCKSYYTGTLDRWVKKKVYGGEVLEALKKMVEVGGDEEAKEQVVGTKRKRDPEKDEDEKDKETKKQKV